MVGDWLDRVAHDGATTVAVDPWGRWPDPVRVVTRLVRCDPALFCRAVAATGPARPTSGGVAAGRWEGAERAARSAVDGVLADEEAGGALSEPALARRLFSSLPAGATLVVASSMPVRDVEAFAAPRAAPPRVLANRGANGIDGVVSTAIGVSLGGPGPVVALVGDLAFLHDASALVGAGGAAPACTVVVADNGGGGIFSFLPQAGILDGGTFESLFGTPQAPDVAAVAAGFGLEVDDVADGTALRRGPRPPAGAAGDVRYPGARARAGRERRAPRPAHAAVADACRAGAVDGTPARPSSVWSACGRSGSTGAGVSRGSGRRAAPCWGPPAVAVDVESTSVAAAGPGAVSALVDAEAVAGVSCTAETSIGSPYWSRGGVVTVVVGELPRKAAMTWGAWVGSTTWTASPP